MTRATISGEPADARDMHLAIRNTTSGVIVSAPYFGTILLRRRRAALHRSHLEGRGSMPEWHGEQTVETTTEAWQGATGHNVMCCSGAVGVIVAFVIVYFLFFRWPGTLLGLTASAHYAWEQDERQLLTASNEGMPGSDEGHRKKEANRLDEVVQAKDQISEKPKHKQSH
jgi:hypothetical protein